MGKRHPAKRDRRSAETRIHVACGMLVIPLFFLGPAYGQADVANPPPPTPTETLPDDDAVARAAELDASLQAYFAEQDAKARGRIAGEINEQVAGDTAALADALRALQIWAPLEPGLEWFDLITQRGKTRVLCRVPPAYDHQRRYPLIVALHGMGGTPRGIIGLVEQLLGAGIDDFIIAAPHDYKGGWFHSPIEDVADPPALMRELRRRFHVDTDRVYVVGYSMGGHGSFTFATFYPDSFAAAVPMAGTLVVQYQMPTFELLLLNLRNLPVLAVWGENDIGDNTRKVTPGGGIAGHNRQLRVVARGLDIPLQPLELKDRGHRDALPPPELFQEYLRRSRDPAPKSIHHCFRYEPQGRSAWLRQRRFGGKPWEGTSIAVLVTGTTDVDEYVAGVLRKKLAVIAGTIEGQSIQVKIRRTAELDVLLNDDLVNLDEPIHLTVGDKTRYEGNVVRRVDTMLDVAYQDWDFQRLYPVRLTMKARSKARQD